MKRYDDGDVVQQWTQLVGANLRALRQMYGKTLEEAARAGNLSVSHLANAEQGRRTLDGEQLRRILQLYEYSLSVFMTHIAMLLDTDYQNTDGSVRYYKPIPLIGRQKDDPTLLLLHPTPTLETPAHCLLRLPPGGELWQDYLVLQSRCSVTVARGAMLVETPYREYILAENEYLALSAGVAHRFRNHTATEARAYIWVETACL